MHVIRPIRHADLSALEAFSLNSSLGLTSLPPDRSLLHQKILLSEHSFHKEVSEPGNELYQLVLEDTDTKTVVGTCAIIASVGWKEPLTFFKRETEVIESKELGICTRAEMLKPVSYLKGPSEVCTLYLNSTHRKGGLGYLLSLCRFLFMAVQPARFQNEVIAQMRGVIDDNGYSPFYESVTRPFFGVDFVDLQDLLTGSRQFITELLPTSPLYTSVFPKEAREVIGKTHSKTLPALRLLLREGFHISSDIDLFDGGPKVSAQRELIRTVEESVCAPVSDITGTPSDSTSFIICNNRLDYRACFGHLEVQEDGTVKIDRDLAEALEIEKGDRLRYVSPRAQASSTRREVWQKASVQP